MLVKLKNNDVSYQGKKVPTKQFANQPPTPQIVNDSTVQCTFNQ